MIRIAVADDHPLFREGLRKALSVGADLQLVGEASDGQQALALCARERPDVLVLDLTMPRCDGFGVLEQLHRVSASTRALVLTVHLEREFEERSLASGARGFLQKDASVPTILKAVRVIASGGVWASRQSTSRVLGATSISEPRWDPFESLTPRERDILDYLRQGLKNREIAEQTGLSEKTVATHVASLVGKLGARGRVEAALFARRQGIAGKKIGGGGSRGPT
jgi:DNA-binding NarL/FixJ family response regulator